MPATVLRHCTPNVFYCVALYLQQQFRESFFFFFFLIIFLTLLFKFCTVATVPLTVVAFFQSSVCIFFNVFHCAVLQLQQQFRESSFFFFFLFFIIFLTLLFKFCTVATVPSSTVATIVAFFQSSVCIFLFFIYSYTDTTNFTIFSQLLKCQFLISQNKIIKYKTVTNHN